MKFREKKIKYVDVTSLYPRVNKTQMHPVGHPAIITTPENRNINVYLDMAKVDILPPPLLYYQLLPYRHRSKLTFPLCSWCMEEEMPKELLDRSCHPRNRQSIGAGVRINLHPRGVAFPRRTEKKGSVCWIWQHLAQDQTGITRIPGLGLQTRKQQYVDNYKCHEGI